MKTDLCTLFNVGTKLHEALLSYILFYGQLHLHISIGYQAPAVFEKSLGS
jgi:hypothetical protein